MKNTLESEVQTKIIQVLNAAGILCKNVHGNMFTSGLPDLWIVNKVGKLLNIELKIWRSVAPPKTVADLANLTHKVQRSVILRAWLMGCKDIYIAATTAKAEHFWFTNGSTVSKRLTTPEFLNWVINTKGTDGQE